MMSRIPVRTSKSYNNATAEPSLKMDDSSKFLKLQKEFEDYRSDKEREIANLEDELEELESKLIHTQQTTSDDPECPGGLSEQLQSENEFLKSKIEELEKRLEEVPDVLPLEEKIRSLKTENEELNNKLDAQVGQLTTMKSKVKKAKNVAKDKESSSNDQLTEELRQAISKHEETEIELSTKLAETEQILKEKTNEFQNLRESRNENAREVDLLKKELLKCESEIDALRNDVTVLEMTNKKNLKSIEGYKNDLRSYCEKLEIMEEEKTQQKKIADHKFRNEQQQQMEIESLHKNLTHLQKKIEDISAEKDSLTQENLKFTEKQRQIEVKLKNSQNIEELKKESSRRASEIITLKDEKMKVYEILKEKRNEYEESLKFYEHKMASLETQNADYRSKIENQETDIFLMSKKLQSSEEEATAIRKKLESQVDETKRLQESVNDLRESEQEKEGRCAEENFKKRKLGADNLAESDMKAENLKKLEKDLKKMKEDLNRKAEELTRREKDLKPSRRSSMEDEESILLAQHQKELETLGLLKKRNDERRTIEYQMSDLLSEKETLELRVSYLTRELEEKNKSLEEVWNDSSRNRRNNRISADLQLTNRQLKSTIDQLEFDLEDVRKENKKLKSTIQDLRGDISEKESQIFSINNNLSARDRESQSLKDDLGDYQWRLTNDMSIGNSARNQNFHFSYSNSQHHHAPANPRAGLMTSPRVSTPSSEVRRNSSFFNFNQPFIDISASQFEE